MDESAIALALTAASLFTDNGGDLRAILTAGGLALALLGIHLERYRER